MRFSSPFAARRIVVLITLKNKTGGQENAEIGYRLYFDARPLTFVPAAEVRKTGAEDE